MPSPNLDEIRSETLNQIKVDGGDVLRALRNNEPGFNGFGEAYFSWIDPGMVKGWKCHTQMTMNLFVPVGAVKFVFHLPGLGAKASFRVENISEHRYRRLVIPPGIWFAFKGMSKNKSLVLNIANIIHDPEEVKRCSLAEITYNWCSE